MEQIIAAFVSAVINSDSFKVAVQEAVAQALTEAKDEGEFVSADHATDIAAEAVKSYNEDVEKMIEEAIDNIDFEEGISEGIDKYFNNSKFTISPTY